MTDEEYKAQKERVERFAAWWGDNLGLRWWNITYIWDRGYGQADAGELRAPMMETETRWQYQDAQIHIYLPSVAEVKDDETVERILVHEYMHIFLNEARPLHDSDDPREHALATERCAHEEHAATMLAKAFLFVRDAAMKASE